MNFTIDHPQISAMFQWVVGIFLVGTLIYFKALSPPDPSRMDRIIYFGGPRTPFTKKFQSMYPPARPGLVRWCVLSGIVFGVLFLVLDIIW